MITADGCWAEFRIARAEAEGRPCLFLDRDGVLIADTGYPHRPEDVMLIDETLDLVRVAGRLGYVTGLVTNQSGIGRGLFEWPAFSAVQRCIDDALAGIGARLDFVLASPHHADATVPRYRDADHPWRKPAPGMLREAAERLGLDLARSVMVGDRLSDLEAAAAAGVPQRWLLQAPGAAAPDPRVAVPVGSTEAAARLRALAASA